MLRRFLTLAALALLVFSITAPAAAQDPAWSLYLINSGTNQLSAFFLTAHNKPSISACRRRTYLGANVH